MPLSTKFKRYLPTAIAGLFVIGILWITFATPYIVRAPLILETAIIAHRHNLDVGQFLRVVECESQWDPSIQSGYQLPNGEYENSWGIAQWNLDTNDITKEEALNPTIALTKMAEAWQDGKAGGWNCYRLWSARNWK